MKGLDYIAYFYNVFKGLNCYSVYLKMPGPQSILFRFSWLFDNSMINSSNNLLFMDSKWNLYLFNNPN